MTTRDELVEHTPGPWFYSQESIDPEWYIVTIKGGLIVANVNAHFRQVANARLIAAAPVMFDYIAKRAAEGDDVARALLAKYSITKREG